MFSAVYILCLALSGGLVGVFAREVLGTLGYIPTLQVGATVAGGAAAGFVGLQLLYIGLLRSVMPTRSGAPLFAESLSQLTALILAPTVLNIPLPWPDPRLERVEALILLVLFVGAHLAVKLLSFFAAMSGKPGPRWPAVLWFGLTAVCAFMSVRAFTESLDALEAARPNAPEQWADYRIGDTYARARVMPEGSVVHADVAAHPGQVLTFRWANLPNAQEGATADRLYITAMLHGDTTEQYRGVASLQDNAWVDWRIPPDRIPRNLRSCTVTWTAERPQAWQKLVKLRPLVASDQDILLSGPLSHTNRELSSAPNFLVVVLDGLGSDVLSYFGYERKTTPELDRFAYWALALPNGFTATPDSMGACMTLLTGCNPLRTGYLGDGAPEQPGELTTFAEVLLDHHYTTVAFTEGEAPLRPDLVHGSGAEQGFELFDASYGDDSRETLAKARAWIREQSDVNFLCFVRLRELGELRYRERYGTEFIERTSRPAPGNVYDTAVHYMDTQVGGLIQYVRDSAVRNNTCIVLTSSYALDFVNGRRRSPVRGLTEGSLRVPVLFYSPGMSRLDYDPETLVAHEDLAPTLLSLANLQFETPVDGQNFLTATQPTRPVSLFGTPLALSLRTATWRYSWQSGLYPFSDKPRDDASPIGLYAVTGSRVGQDQLRRRPQVAQELEKQLEDYLTRNTDGAN